MREEKILLSANFDPRLRTYWFLEVLLICFATCVGVLFVPIWLLGLGKHVVAKRYERMRCHLTERSIQIRRGYLFRVEKTIPLDKIQDVALHEGPLLRQLGLYSLRIETAGQSHPQGGSEATLVGVSNAFELRDAILEQRDAVVERAAAGLPPESSGAPQVLEEIRDALLRIETRLPGGGEPPSTPPG